MFGYLLEAIYGQNFKIFFLHENSFSGIEIGFLSLRRIPSLHERVEPIFDRWMKSMMETLHAEVVVKCGFHDRGMDGKGTLANVPIYFHTTPEKPIYFVF